MVEFYDNRDATEMMAFVLDCHPEIVQIRKLNPGLSAIEDLPAIQYIRHDEPTQQTRPLSPEETQRQARENWRRNYYEKGTNRMEPSPDSTQSQERKYEDEVRREAGTGLDLDSEL
jgi:hypothetical protein